MLETPLSWTVFFTSGEILALLGGCPEITYKRRGHSRGVRTKPFMPIPRVISDVASFLYK